MQMVVRDQLYSSTLQCVMRRGRGNHATHFAGRLNSALQRLFIRDSLFEKDPFAFLKQVPRLQHGIARGNTNSIEINRRRQMLFYDHLHFQLVKVAFI